MMQGMRAIREEQNSQLATVLSTEQMTRYRELQQEMRGRVGERSRNRRGKRGG
jgi:hypothetical protein